MIIDEIRSEPLSGPAQLGLKDNNLSLKTNQLPLHYLLAQNIINPRLCQNEI